MMTLKTWNDFTVWGRETNHWLLEIKDTNWLGLYTLLHLCFCLVTDMSKFHFKIEKLKEILLSNGHL